MNRSSNESLRIDRWLWFARFYKSRAQATKAVTGGHVKVNGERSKPGHAVVPGDEIEIVRRQLTYRLTVVAIPTRRGPSAEAQACYREDDSAVERREQHLADLRRDRQQMPRTDGRPDKHTRRRLRSHNRRGGVDSS